MTNKYILNTFATLLLWLLPAVLHGANDAVVIEWKNDRVEISNPCDTAVTVSTDGCNVVVESLTPEAVNVALSGRCDDGSVQLLSLGAFNLTLSNLHLHSQTGAAIGIHSEKKSEITINGDNTLEDCDQRDEAIKSDAKAVIYCISGLTLKGKGRLSVSAHYKHGVYSDKTLKIQDATIAILISASDGIRGKKDVNITNAQITARNTGKHAINSDKAGLNIDNCNIDIIINQIDAKGLAATADMLCNNSVLNLQLCANATKGIKSDGSITLLGSTLVAEATGGIVIAGEDKSYCAIIKCDSCLTIDGCTAQVQHKGEGGKGFSCDSTFVLRDSHIKMQLTGNGAPYLVNMGNDLDFFTPRCIESKGDMYIVSGEYTFHASGTGGKGIVCDSTLTIGVQGQDDALLRIDITTEGTAVIDDVLRDERFGCPKAIRCGKAIFVESGHITAQTNGMGGEGLESKGYLTVNGGTIVSEAYDDGINVEKGITINGGCIYATSTDNDGIDSNGFIELNGGIVASLTSHEKDEDFDCDDDTFFLSGGTVCGIGRDYSGIYKVGQPYIQHISVIKDKKNGIIDSVAVYDILKDKYITYTNSQKQPIMTVKVHANIKAAYTTMTSPMMTDGENVYVYMTDNVPAGADAIIEGKVWTGGTLDEAEQPLFADVSTVEPYKETALIPKGDVNNDGQLSVADVSLVVEFALGHWPQGKSRQAADVNGDGIITAADISLIVSYILNNK